MENNGYIAKVNQPTEWVSSTVLLTKITRSEFARIPQIWMNSSNEISQIHEAKAFSVLDAKRGFLQIKLDDNLTTFNSPVARYRWLRSPLQSNPLQIHRRAASRNWRWLSYNRWHFNSRQRHHDMILIAVLDKATLKLNLKKCCVRKSSVKWDIWSQLATRPRRDTTYLEYDSLWG